MFEKLLFYLQGFQRSEFYSVMILLGSTISRKTQANSLIQIEILSSACLFNLKFLGIAKAKCPNEAICSKLNA